MVDWLENNRPVDYIVSTKYKNDNATAGVSFTRKLCPVGCCDRTRGDTCELINGV